MSEKREGTGQRRMRIWRTAVVIVDAFGDFGVAGDAADMRKRAHGWPGATRSGVALHADNLRALMRCDISHTLAESGPGEPKSAPIDAWRESSGLGKPAEQLLRTLCAMGQMSRVKKRAKGSDSRRKVWHYGFFDALSFYRRVPRGEWPTRDGETVSADDLQRYGGAWDVAERADVDAVDYSLRHHQHIVGVNSLSDKAMTLAVGIACGRYVVNEDGTVSMAVSGWGATSRPVGEMDGEPVAPTGETDADTGLPLLDTVHGCGTVADRADPDHARAAFAEMRGEAQYTTTGWTPDDNCPMVDTDTVEAHRFTVIVIDHEGDGREALRHELNERKGVAQDCVAGDGQTITVEWHDRHPLNLTDTDADAWFTAEHARQSGAPTDVDAMRTRIAELEAERDAMAQAYTRDRAAWTESVADISGKRDAAVAARDAAVKSAGSLQTTLDNVAAILGANPTCNPDVEMYAHRAAEGVRQVADARDALDTAMYQNSPLPDAVAQTVAMYRKRIQELADERDAWQGAMSAVALAITGSTPYDACTPDDIRDECIRAISSTPRQFTEVELRAMRRALEDETISANEDADRRAADYADRLDRVAATHSALAKVIRALPTA